MIGSMNEKTAFPVPAPEAKPLAGKLFQRKESGNRETGATGFQNYLKSVTDQTKPPRETGSKSTDQKIGQRQEERVESKSMDSPRQVVKEDKNRQTSAVQNKNTDETGEVSDKTPEPSMNAGMADQNVESQTTENTQALGMSLNPGVQMPVNDGIQLTVALTGVQSAGNLAAMDNLPQLQAGLPMEELPQYQIGAGNQNGTTGQTLAAQSVVDELMGPGANSQPSTGQTATAFNPGMAQAMEALLADETADENNNTRETGSQAQIKVTGTGGNGPNGSVLSKPVLEVYQDKVTAQTAIQNLSQSKDDLHQSLQNAAMERNVATGDGNKPVNLAVLQTQLAVGESLDKTNAMGMPLQQQQPLGGVQVQETAGTAQTAGKDQLFNQIIEHAKLMLSGNQSELEMSLKPEHLGKLQLKVLVENQVVTARFLAESQQVKQIIESNLNQLRDQLRESGLQVDHLSVSVGNGGQEQFFGQTNGNPSQFGGQGSSHGTTDGNDLSSDGEAVSTPRSLQETVIDLIA